MASKELITPYQILSCYENLAGKITLDVASSSEAAYINGIDNFYDEKTDGYKQSWKDNNCLIHPPRGKSPGHTELLRRNRALRFQQQATTGLISTARIWFRESMRRWLAHELDSGIFILTGSASALFNTIIDPAYIGLSLPPVCYLDPYALEWITEDEEYKKPKAAMAFWFFALDTPDPHEQFNDYFSQIGRCV